MKLRNKQLRSKEVSVKVQKKQSGAERMRKLREKKKAQSSLLKFFQSDKKIIIQILKKVFIFDLM